ncbi:MAG: ankyrin repeat domain-containing protein [Planctomycetota bacterium]|jgi:ankyrin repeat protein
MFFFINYFEYIVSFIFFALVFCISRSVRGHGRLKSVMMACRLNDIRELRFLLRATPWLAQHSDSMGLTPLHVTALSGSEEATGLLIKNSADVNARNSSGMTPLHTASITGNLEVIKILVQHGAIINCKDLKGNSPLFLAVWDGHMDVAEYLIRHGANVNSCTEHGESALCRAAQHGHIELAQILKTAGAKPTARSERFEKEALERRKIRLSESKEHSI